jgi:phytoene synthase
MSDAASDVDGNADSAAFCADLVRGHDFVRYASTLFMPADRRRGLLALYAFNVEIFRVRDQVSQPLPGEIRLQWWTDMLAGQGQGQDQGKGKNQGKDQDHGGAEGNPVAAELLRAIREYRLPVEPLARLIEEHQFDLYNDPMPTLAALEGYVTDTSSALFALAARIAGPASAEVEHLARHAGLAQGFNEVIAALPRDAARRQLFLPLQLLESHGVSMEEVFSGKQTPNTRAALQQLIGEAQGHLDTALSLLADVAPDQRPVFLPLSLLRRDLNRMLRADADPFLPRMRSRLSILWTLWRKSRSEPFKAG